MQEHTTHPATEDLRPLDAAEILDVSGARMEIDMGILGTLVIDRCISLTFKSVNTETGCISWSTTGQC